jgi:CrcB protein
VVLIFLSIGGVLGTLARYGISGWILTGSGTGFPWGTLTVNVLGSLILGYALRGMEVIPLTPEMRAFATVGFCGAFTTFSTFSYETVELLQGGAWVRAGLYVLGSVLLGLAAMYGGISLAALTLRASA